MGPAKASAVQGLSVLSSPICSPLASRFTWAVTATVAGLSVASSPSLSKASQPTAETSVLSAVRTTQPLPRQGVPALPVTVSQEPASVKVRRPSP